METVTLYIETVINHGENCFVMDMPLKDAEQLRGWYTSGNHITIVSTKNGAKREVTFGNSNIVEFNIIHHEKDVDYED